MLKAIPVLILIVLCGLPATAQSSADAELRQLRSDLMRSLQNQDLKGAEKVSEKTIKLTEKAFGVMSIEAAATYSVHGTILKARGKLKDAEEALLRALRIFDTVGLPKDDAVKRTMEELGSVYALDKKYPSALRYYKEATSLGIDLFGDESMEVYAPAMNTGKLFALMENNILANKYFLIAYVPATKSNDLPKITEVRDARVCMIKNGDMEKDGYLEEMLEGEPVHILNGKAMSLPKPFYPREGKYYEKGGRVVVRITLDVNGNVTDAESVCGNSLFYRESELAAKRAKFSQTLKDGIPIGVSGYITYNFLPTKLQTK